MCQGESQLKYMFLDLEEKISDVHTEDRRIRKEISPSTEASLAKASLYEKFSNTERLHQPDLSASHKQQKVTLYMYIYIVYIIVTPLYFNKQLVIVNRVFLFIANTLVYSSYKPLRPSEVLDRF